MVLYVLEHKTQQISSVFHIPALFGLHNARGKVIVKRDCCLDRSYSRPCVPYVHPFRRLHMTIPIGMAGTRPKQITNRVDNSWDVQCVFSSICLMMQRNTTNGTWPLPYAGPLLCASNGIMRQCLYGHVFKIGLPKELPNSLCDFVLLRGVLNYNFQLNPLLFLHEIIPVHWFCDVKFFQWPLGMMKWMKVNRKRLIFLPLW